MFLHHGPSTEIPKCTWNTNEARYFQAWNAHMHFSILDTWNVVNALEGSWVQSIHGWPFSIPWNRNYLDFIIPSPKCVKNTNKARHFQVWNVHIHFPSLDTWNVVNALEGSWVQSIHGCQFNFTISRKVLQNLRKCYRIQEPITIFNNISKIKIRELDPMHLKSN